MGPKSSFKDLEKGVKRLNPNYMVPVNEASQVVSDPQTAKMAQPVKDQPSSSSPPKGSRFNPIYVEPGSTSINSTRDLQVLFPNSFDCIGDIKTDPTVPPVQHKRYKVSIEYKEEIEKELGEMVCQGIIMKQTEPTTWVSSLTYPEEANGKLRICLNPKDLNKAIIHENYKAHNPRGDSPCSQRSNKILRSWQQQSILLDASDGSSFTPHNVQHTPWQVQISLYTIWTQNESGHFPGCR